MQAKDGSGIQVNDIIMPSPGEFEFTSIFDGDDITAGTQYEGDIKVYVGDLESQPVKFAVTTGNECANTW